MESGIKHHKPNWFRSLGTSNKQQSSHEVALSKHKNVSFSYWNVMVQMVTGQIV
jgi:hypothetical protein